MKGKSMPGPGEYGRADAPRPSTGVKFNEGNAKNDIEWMCYRAAQTPGPGDYQVPSTLDVSPKKVGGGLDRTVLAEHFGGLAEDGSPSPSKKKKKRWKKKKKKKATAVTAAAECSAAAAEPAPADVVVVNADGEELT